MSFEEESGVSGDPGVPDGLGVSGGVGVVSGPVGSVRWAHVDNASQCCTLLSPRCSTPLRDA